MAKEMDSRFARLQTDPRFRRPKQKNLKVEIDERFRDVLESEEFGGKGKGKGKGAARVDKRGRPLTGSHHSDQLKHFYRLRSPSPSAETPETGFVDYARGEGALESSGSEGGSDEESEVEEEELEIGGQKRAPLHAIPDDYSDSESDDSHLEIDLSDEEEPSAFPAEKDEGEDEEEEEEYAEPTKRIAAVNLDWDNLRASDLYSVFNSFLKSSISNNGESSTAAGKLLNVKIYPSEFGKARMEKEELEGPGGGIFISKPGEKRKGKGKGKEAIITSSEDEDDDEDEDDEDEDDEDSVNDDGLEEDGFEDDEDEENEEEDDLDDAYDDESEEEETVRKLKGPEEIDGLEIVSDLSDAGEDDIDMDQLRQYQLERLRYFYAVATFSSVDAAMKVLSECNGTEFERTANMFDLSYVPDEMEFEEDDVKDVATKELKGYKGNDFVTDALRHSKVKLTWDQDDPNRIKLTRRNLTREEIEEEDFKAYLASSGSESEDEGPITDTTAVKVSGSEKKKSKKALSKERTDKLRALLLNGNDEDGDVWGKAGLSNADDVGSKKTKGEEVEITFTPGLSATANLDDENLTSLEKYQMRMKERKARKKEKLELKRAQKDDGAADSKAKAKDDFFGDEDSDDEKAAQAVTRVEPEHEEEGEEKLEEQLGLKGVEHFSMKDILKAEKGEGKKKRRRVKKKRNDDEREVELGTEGWKIDVKDERFKALHEEPDFAIDPSNPHFTKTKAMQDLLAERAGRSKKQSDRAPIDKQPVSQPNHAESKEKDLDALVQSVKRKMGEGGKKHRKRSKK